MRNRTTQTLKIIAVVTLVTAVFATNRSFADKPISILTGFSEKEEAKMKEIEKALDKTGTIELKDTPLRKLPAILSEQLGVNVHLDKNAFEDASIDLKETTLNNQHKNISCRAAIKLFLSEIGADVIVHNEVLLITTKERINSDPAMRITKIYPVEELIVVIEEPEGRGGERPDFDSIIDLIQTTIETESWQDAGEGEGTISGYETNNIAVLVVSQTPDVHRKIEILLTKLRKYHQSQKKEKKNKAVEKK